MANFTYTDRNPKVIRKSWGRFRATVMEAVVVGDLVNRYETDAVSTYQFADATGSQAAQAVVVSETIAAAGTGWLALAAELKAPATIGAGGAVTQQYFAGADDYLGKVLYLGDAGKPSSSSGTLVQEVGHLVARDRILLTPGGGLVSGAAAFTTLTSSSTTAFSGNTTIGTGKNLTLTKGDLTMTEGDLTLTKGAATMTVGDLTMTKGDVIVTQGLIKPSVKDGVNEAYTAATYEVLCCELTDNRTITLPTAAAGLRYTVIHKSGDKIITILPASNDKLIDNCGAQADGGVHTQVVDDKGLDCFITLQAVDDTNWVPIAFGGTWTFTDA